jgi:hypothetical protein
VARIIPANKKNKIKSFLHGFGSLSLSFKILIIALILFAISTPFMIYSYQIYRTRAESQSERLAEIQRLQTNQENINNSLARSDPNIKNDVTTTSPSPEKKIFSLLSVIDWLREMFSNIIGFLKNPIPPLKHR